MNKEFQDGARTQAREDTSKLRKEAAVWGTHSGVGRIFSYAADLIDPDMPEARSKACCAWHWGQPEQCQVSDQEPEQVIEP